MTPSGASPESLLQQAMVLHRAGHLARAEAVYRQVLKIAPDHADACYRLGHLCNVSGRLDEAVVFLKQAIAHNPRHARAYNTLGMALDGLGEPGEALDCYRKAVRMEAGSYEFQYNLGSALLSAGRIDDAVLSLEKAIAIEPGRGFAQVTLGQALIRQGDLERATALLKQALIRLPDLAPAHDLYLFALNYLQTDRETLFAAHRAYGERTEKPLKPAWPAHRNDRDPDRRLKIGYVSPDFRQHSVAMFIEPVLVCHDKSRFEIHAYHASPLRDATTERLAACTDRWLQCETLGDMQLAARIAADGIDILVDLAGHTTGNRLAVFARRPAPVQVSYLGYPATTGLSAIDYRLVTADTDPPGAEAWHSEGLWRLPRSLWCYRPNPEAPPVDPVTPARRNGHVRFVSANNVAKLSDATVATWSRVLAAVPGSTLTLSGIAEGRAQALIRERFRAHGIAVSRVIVHGKLPAQGFWSLLSDADIALDPYPYNGTTTSCESLWMGLPLVTLTGASSAGRSGHALLKTLGLEELAAPDEADYVRIASALASDLPRLDRLRATMRDRIFASPLRDESALTRDLESAYRAIWQTWCAR